jgi:hypothetical protein
MRVSSRTSSVSRHLQPLPKKREKKQKTNGVIFKRNKAFRQAIAILREAGRGLGLTGSGLSYFVSYKSAALKIIQ